MLWQGSLQKSFLTSRPAPARVAWPQHGQILVTAKEIFTYQHLYLISTSETLIAPWASLTASTRERSREEMEHLLDFYHEDEPAKRKKKIPYISTESRTFLLYFGKRLLTGLSLSCTIQTIAYLNLTTPIYRYCIWHSGSEPGLGQTLAVLQHKWTTKKSEQLQALKVLTVRFSPFIQSMDSFFNNLGEGRIFEACLTAVTAFPAMYSELSLEKTWPTQTYPFTFKNGMWDLGKQHGVKEYIFKLLSKSLTNLSSYDASDTVSD